MKLKIFVFISMNIFIISGCAIQGVNSANYTDPIQVQIQNEVVVKKIYSQVWDGLVKEISKSFYVINNIDKESRIINLSFTTNSPADFIDCGKSHRTYTQGDKVEVFDYDTAGSAKIKIAGQQHPSWASYAIFSRDSILEGRANIYIAPDDKDKNNTIITINTRYNWINRTKGEAFNENARGYSVSAGRIPEEITSVSFNTNTKGEIDAGNGLKLTCVSKGKLESEILDLVRK